MNGNGYQRFFILLIIFYVCNQLHCSFFSREGPAIPIDFEDYVISALNCFEDVSKDTPVFATTDKKISCRLLPKQKLSVLIGKPFSGNLQARCFFWSKTGERGGESCSLTMHFPEISHTKQLRGAITLYTEKVFHLPEEAELCIIEAECLGLQSETPREYGLELSMESLGPVPAVRTENPPLSKHVFYVIFDALRADELTLDNSSGNTPHLTSFARQALFFERAYAEASYTITSTASLLSGQSFFEHGVNSRFHEFQDPTELLQYDFTQRGYRTFALYANGMARKCGLNSHFSRAMEIWNEDTCLNRPPFGSDMVRTLRPVIAEERDNKCFWYLHFREPHSPYNPPAEFLEKARDKIDNDGSTERLKQLNRQDGPIGPETIERLRNLYRGMIRSADSSFGEFIELLKQNDIDDSSTIVLLSDHGEAFGEHGKLLHSSTVYDEMLRIPCIIKFPGNTSPRVFSPLIAGSDVTNYLKFLLRNHPESSEDSNQLHPFSRILQGWNRPAPILARSAGKSFFVALLIGNMKYIHQVKKGPVALFNLRTDPREKTNLLQEYPELVLHLSSIVEDRIQKMEKGTENQNEPDPEDPALIQNLRQLGYVD